MISDSLQRSRFLLSAMAVFAKRARAIFTPVSLFFAIYFLVTEHDVVMDAISVLSLSGMIVILLLIGIGHLLISGASACLFHAYRVPVTFLGVLSIHVNRLPARYLPGGVWQTVSRALDFSANGVRSRVITRVMLLEMAVAVALAATVGGFLGAAQGGGEPEAALALLPLAGILLLIIGPFALNKVLSDSDSIDAISYAMAAAAFAFVWLIYGSAFFFYLSASGLANLGWAKVVEVYLLSWLVGFLTIFAPQGIGVFEATSSYLITGEFAGRFIAVVFGFRILAVTADFVIWAVFRVIAYMQPVLLAVGNRLSLIKSNSGDDAA